MKAVKGKRCHLSLSYLKKIIQLNRKQFHFQALSSKTKGLLAVKQLNSTQLSNSIQSSASHPVSSDNGVGDEHDDSLYNTGLPLTRAVTSTRLECTEQVDEIFDSANPKSCPSQQSILKRHCGRVKVYPKYITAPTCSIFICSSCSLWRASKP